MLLSGQVYSTSEADDLAFDLAMKEELNFQIAGNSNYARFLAKLGWSAGEGLRDIPAVPVSVFKHIPEFTRVGAENGFQLKSSGTSGRQSEIFVDQETSRRQKRSLQLVMESFLGKARRHAFVFDQDPRVSRTVGARQAAVIGYSRSALSSTFLAEEQEGKLRLIEGWRARLSDLPDEPVLVIGFTYVLYNLLIDSSTADAIRLPEGSKVIHIGGWKKLEQKKVPPSQLKSLLCDAFGISPDDVHDVYGFTELLGVNFFECPAGWKHVPKWARAHAVEMTSLTRLPDGDKGLLTFSSPIPHSYTGLSMVTDDIGFLDPEKGPCRCGREGARLQVSGRRPKAEIRGCGDILGEVWDSPQSKSPQNEEVKIKFPIEATRQTVEFAPIISEVVAAQKKLSSLSLSEILAVIEQMRLRWVEFQDSDASGFLRTNGLGYLIQWSEPQKLRNLLDTEIVGGRRALDTWVRPSQETSSLRRSLPRGVVGQWVSGNVPSLALYPIIQSWLTKNAIISRLSSRGNDFTQALLRPLSELAQRDATARIMESATLLVGFHRDNQDAQHALSRSSNVLIAWGGRQALDAISNLPTKPEATKILFGPRTSFALVFESMLNTSQKMRAVARRIVADSSVFEQAACASPHSVFVVSDNPNLVEAFGEFVSAEFKRKVENESLARMDSELLSEILLYRRRRLLDSLAVHAIGGEATVVVSNAHSQLPEPVFGRTLHILRADSCLELIPYVTEETQSVGLLGTPAEALLAAELLGSAGVKRFPEIGRMTNFEEPWDGISILRSITRPATLGGPD